MNVFFFNMYQNNFICTIWKSAREESLGGERERDGVPCDRYTDWLQAAPPLSSSPGVRCRGAVSPSPFQFRLERRRIRLRSGLGLCPWWGSPGSWATLQWPPSPSQKKKTPGWNVQRPLVCVLFCKMQVSGDTVRNTEAWITWITCGNERITGTREFMDSWERDNRRRCSPLKKKKRAREDPSSLCRRG